MNTASQPLVSVVTPVYNGAQYLTECIESVLAQTYQNWDYTIVNNCSTDKTGEIARQYACKDSRIRVHENQEFLPICANHNASLRQISPESKYCKLVFADDWLFPECLERMVALGEAHPSVGIVNAYGLRGSEVLWTGLPYPSTVVPGHHVCRLRLHNGPYVFGTGTSQLYRADLVRSRAKFFNEANLHCDSEVCFQLLQDCDFGFVHQVLHYTRTPDPESWTMRAYRMHTLEAMTLYELRTYGPIYLAPQELQSLMKAKLAEYYGILAQSVLEGGASWGFHRDKLSEFGLHRGRLAWALLVRAFRGPFTHPLRSIKAFLGGTSVLSGRLKRLVRAVGSRDLKT
jgi:glycosyltransferase involved in cell wall biosynthesis